ncbi:MAG: hypothetical protein VST71_00065 [Nitrospirota bacterium]|nr:hypothetical protein [Nitrospirota bacterium]
MRIAALSLILFFLVGCSNSLDEKKIKSNPSFVMGDKLMCTIIQSSDKNDIGKNLTFTGLNSSFPDVLFESGMNYSFRKRFENERTLSLVLAGESKSGGIDSFVIDKKTGKFSRVSAGLITFSGVYAVASLGVCN